MRSECCKRTDYVIDKTELTGITSVLLYLRQTALTNA